MCRVVLFTFRQVQIVHTSASWRAACSSKHNRAEPYARARVCVYVVFYSPPYNPMWALERLRGAQS